MIRIPEKSDNCQPNRISKCAEPSLSSVGMSAARVSALLRGAVAFVLCASAAATGAHSPRGFTSVELAGAQKAADDPSLVGSWSKPYNWPVVAGHAVLLQNGKVLLWSDGNNVQLWDPATGDLTRTPNAFNNISGAGHVTRADGTPMIIGGSSTTMGARTQALTSPSRTRRIPIAPCG
jgi:hypothetical protein